MLGQVFHDNGMSYTLSVMPLFVLMGNFVLKAGLADDMYAAANAWLRQYRGGLAMATVVACGGFAVGVRLVARHRRHHGTGVDAVHAPLRLFRRARHRRHRRRRHARHPDPAVHRAGALRGHHPERHRQAVPRRHPAGPRRHSRLHDRGAHLARLERREIAGGGSAAADRAAAGDQGRLGRAPAVRRRHGRHLSRHLHGQRGGRRRRLRGVPDRPAARPARPGACSTTSWSRRRA